MSGFNLCNFKETTVQQNILTLLCFLFGFKVEERLEDTLSVNQVKQEPKESTLSIGAKTFLDCKKLSAT